ncbi:hypothetical protein [Actinophytocola sp.]
MNDVANRGRGIDLARQNIANAGNDWDAPADALVPAGAELE